MSRRIDPYLKNNHKQKQDQVNQMKKNSWIQ